MAEGGCGTAAPSAAARGGRPGTDFGGTRRAGVRRRARRAVAADLPDATRLRRLRDRRDRDGDTPRHGAVDARRGPDRTPPFAAAPAPRRGAVDGGDRGGICDGDGVLAAPRHRLCRHDQPDLGRCRGLSAARTDRARRGRRAGAAHRALRALQSRWLACRRPRRARRLPPGLRRRVARLDRHCGDAGDVRALWNFGALDRAALPAAVAGRRGGARGPAGAVRQSKKLVYGLAALFGMDSFGIGFFVQSLLALWLYRTFTISVTTTAAILFWSGLFSAASYLLAAPLARRIGLV